MALHVWPKASMQAMPSLRSVSSGSPFVASLGLRLGLRLPPPPIVIVLAGDSREHVWANEAEETTVSPTLGVKRIKHVTDGHHTWTDAEIAQYH